MDEPIYHFQWTQPRFMASIKLRSRAKVLASDSVRAIRFFEGAIRSNALDLVFVCIYEIVAEDGGPSIAPGKLIRVLQVQVLYSISNQSALMKKVSCSMLFRWFVTPSKDDVVRDHSTVRKNHDRLLEDGANVGLFNETVDAARACGYLQGEHFSVDCTLIQVWARDESFVHESKFVVGPTLPATGDEHVLAIGDRAGLLPDCREGRCHQLRKLRSSELSISRHTGPLGLTVSRCRHSRSMISVRSCQSATTTRSARSGRSGSFATASSRGRFAQLGHLIFDRRHQRALHGFSRRPGGGLPNGSVVACSRASARRDATCDDIA